MKTMLLALAVTGLLGGCSGESLPPAEDACRVPTGWTVGYQDCGVQGCVADCGILSSDGSAGHLLPAGCSVAIGTSSTYEALCVQSCGECR